MDKNKMKSLLLILIVLSIFPISYIYRRYVKSEISHYSKFTVGSIYDFTTSLKSSNAWHYKFKYNGKVYLNSKPTHVDYSVNIGDYFLVNFSCKDPNKSEIFYEYKLKSNQVKYTDSVWDTIPLNIFRM